MKRFSKKFFCMKIIQKKKKKNTIHSNATFILMRNKNINLFFLSKKRRKFIKTFFLESELVF